MDRRGDPVTASTRKRGVSKMRKKDPRAILQLKITLAEIEPPIWRRVLVPAETDLGSLHDLLQAAMGWTNSHLHQFTLRDRRFSDPRLDDDGELEFEDERRVRLDQLVGAGQALGYEYDFGDSWEHEVLVEKILEPDSRMSYPACIAGARACPPEDVGGTTGYARLLESIADPRDPERDEFLTWLGGVFDPEGFDLNLTNRALRGGRPP
jgi:Plasmid pRiA4b ORF-3-like protein